MCHYSNSKPFEVYCCSWHPEEGFYFLIIWQLTVLSVKRYYINFSISWVTSLTFQRRPAFSLVLFSGKEIWSSFIWILPTNITQYLCIYFKKQIIWMVWLWSKAFIITDFYSDMAYWLVPKLRIKIQISTAENLSRAIQDTW